MHLNHHLQSLIAKTNTCFTTKVYIQTVRSKIPFVTNIYCILTISTQSQTRPKPQYTQTTLDTSSTHKSSEQHAQTPDGLMLQLPYHLLHLMTMSCTHSTTAPIRAACPDSNRPLHPPDVNRTPAHPPTGGTAGMTSFHLASLHAHTCKRTSPKNISLSQTSA